MSQRMLKPIYTTQSCGRTAYQLNWSYSVFWRNAPSPASSWLEALGEILESRDQIRLLRHRFEGDRTSQFLVSTRPQLSPVKLVQRIKGRFQHLLPTNRPFRRNFSLTSVGSARGCDIDRYLANQLDHHWHADPAVMRRLEPFQFFDPQVDLNRFRYTSHGRYLYNLHVVLECKPEEEEFGWGLIPRILDRTVRAATRKGHLLSRVALLPNHLHLSVGCNPWETPEEVALSYLNNLAHACDMKAIFRHGYYVGTFGEYNLGVMLRD